MQKKVVSSGDVIIRQGDKGDMFYVVDSGNFDVYVAQNGKSPVKVMTYPGSGSFGELSIMYGKPRAATVVAASGGTLWTLERKAFRRLVMKSSATSLMRTLRSVDVLKALSNEQVQRLYDMLTETSFKSNEHIITQGDQGDEFFVIKEGTVKCTIRDDESSKGKFKEVLRLSAGEYFGERALLSSQPRAANVIAVGNVKCLQISRAAFEEVLGPLRNIIDSDRQRRESKGRKSMKSSTILPAGLRQPDIAKAGQKDFKIVSTVHTAENNSSDLCIVRHLKGRMFSMKRFNKSIVKDQNMGHRVVAAKDAMLQLANSRCIPEILATFIDNNCLHILMGTISCIMFDELLETLGTMAEDQARFYAQCAVSALQVLHARKIVLRAIYPEALTVDQSGYLLLSDFMMCKDLSQDGRTSTLLGNPEYLAPEMVAAGAGHGLAVDAWALGILIHELIMGRTPFESDNEKEIYDAIVAHKSGGINIKSSSSSACNSFINALLHPKDAKRLGSGKNGATEITRHAWLKDANWADLESGRAVCPHADQVQAAFKEIVSKKKVKSDVASIPYVGDDDWFEGF